MEGIPCRGIRTISTGIAGLSPGLERFAGLGSRKSVDMSPFLEVGIFLSGLFWAIFRFCGLKMGLEHFCDMWDAFELVGGVLRGVWGKWGC